MKKIRRLPLNLQFFAEGEPAGEPAGEPSGEPGGDAGSNDEGVEKAFAARLSKEKSKLEGQYSPYVKALERQATQSNMTVDQYIAHLEEQALAEEAEEKGKTPAELKAQREKDALEQELQSIKRKDKLTAEEKALTSDPKIGKFVTDNLDAIRKIADEAGVDLRTGLALIATEKLPDLLDEEAIIKGYLEGVRTGKRRPVEIGGGASGAPAAKTPRTFEEARKSALEKFKQA